MSHRYRDARREAHGADRGKTSSDPSFHRPAITAPECELALLRATWDKRDLLHERARAMIWSFLRRAERRPLTPAQLEAAKAIGRSVGNGFDDPAFDDEPGTSATTRPAQPWGPLPLKPPGR